MYSPVRVSTLMRSPGLTNSGTCSTSPVSRVAGLRAPDTRSPCTPGFGRGHRQLHGGRQVHAHDLVVVHLQHGAVALLHVLGGLAQGLGLTWTWSYETLSMKT